MTIKRNVNTPVQVKAAFWALICGILQKGVNVITTPIFTRLLSTSEYGQYNVFNSWLQIVTIIVSLNIYAGVFHQGLVKFENDSKRFASSMQGLSITLTIFWLIVYLPFYKFWNGLLSLTTIQILSMLLLIWLSAIIGFWSAEQRNRYKYKALIAVTLTASVLSPVLSILLIKNSEDKVTARILGSVIIAFIVYIPLYIIQLKKGKQFYSAYYWKYAVMFNLPLIPHYLSQVVLSSSDRIMIERMVSDSAAGIYGLAYSLSLIMTIFNNALLQTLSPWVYQKIKAKEINKIAPIAYASLLGIAAINFMLIIIAPEAVRIFAPPEYYDAIWIIPPVAISVYYLYSYDMFAKFAFYYEKRLFITIASVIGAVLNIILNFIFIRKYGYVAAGYTTLVCYIVYALGHYIFMNRVCIKNCDGIKPYNGKIILLISSVFTICGLAMLLTYNHAIIRYAILAISFANALVFGKKIIEFIKSILTIRKTENV